MPERAEASLVELNAALEASLEAASDARRPGIEAEIVWCLVERGAIGAALERVCEDRRALPPALRTSLRAELHAWVGNEEAALGLLSDAPAAHVRALVRARVCAARGDWEGVLSHIAVAAQGREGRSRALRIGARAALELGRREVVAEMLEALAAEAGVEGLEARLLRRDSADSVRAVANEALGVGALRLAADAWGDLALLERDQDASLARRTATSAVEIWDDAATSLPPPLRHGFWRDAKRRAVKVLSRPEAPGEVTKPASALLPLLDNLRKLASERDLEGLLSVMTDGAVALSGAERGLVLLTDAQGGLEPATVRDAEARAGTATAAFSQSIAETVLIDGEPIVTVDAEEDHRVRDYLSVHQLMLKSVACLPIRSRSRTWGVLYLEHRSQRGRFSGADLNLLRAYADQAAIALETAHLWSKVQAQKQALEEANEALRYANEQLERRMQGQAETLRRTEREVARLQASVPEGVRWGLVGVSASMRKLYEVIERVALTEVPVALFGESGTGKELVARAIHQSSARADAPFVSLNCGAIPEGLLESELFGHVAGAFTGAERDRTGVFVQASGGTLFLDEVSDMPARMQVDLLRVIQERTVRPVGGAAEQAIDVRLVSSSNRPLETLVTEGRIRDDLYYRLAVVELRVPPLRERLEDLPLLCEHFLSRLAKEQGAPRKMLSRDALRRLGTHSFPGNVRELEHLLINAAVFSRADTIEADELALGGSPPDSERSVEPQNYQDFKGVERDRIVATLNAHGWNRAKAARALGMARRTFYRRLKEHGIELPKSRS
ncbi:MAG: sigma-54-dependent Fis family transcriptional regulator [Myxococcota bacterium]